MSENLKTKEITMRYILTTENRHCSVCTDMHILEEQRAKNAHHPYIPGLENGKTTAISGDHVDLNEHRQAETAKTIQRRKRKKSLQQSVGNQKPGTLRFGYVL
jgi:hypothetical protein